MFTGIVDHRGVIKKIIFGNKTIRVWISCDFNDLIAGESISVNGVCLTAIDPENNLFQADISPETFQLTNAKYLQEGSIVNLERSLRLSDRLGGHFVLGHVDKVCELKDKIQNAEFTTLIFTGLMAEDKFYFVKKGSVCVNGISLTINEVYADGFQVMIIPHTLERTNLKEINVGDKVNIEFDWLARITVNWLEQTK